MSVNFFSNGLCTFCSLVQGELIELSMFHSEIESSWEKRDEKLQEDISAILEKHPEEKYDDIVSAYSQNLHLNQIKYPNIHRESLVITIHSFLENHLNELCKILRETNTLDLKLKHLHGSSIKKALLYLSKVLNIDLSDMSPELPFLENVNKLRNIIVHSGTLPKGNSHPTNIFVTQTESLSGEPERQVQISKVFLNEYLDHMSEFFKKLDDKIQAYMAEKNA